jgi:hypothetical protein
MNNEEKPVILLGQLVDTTELMIDSLKTGNYRAVDEIVKY